jgi:hypothetical protein
MEVIPKEYSYIGALVKRCRCVLGFGEWTFLKLTINAVVLRSSSTLAGIGGKTKYGWSLRLRDRD